MSDLAEVNRILGLPTVPYETLHSMKTLAGKLTKVNAEIHWTTSLLITQRPLDTGLHVEMLFDTAPFEADDSPLRVFFDEVIEKRLHTFSINVLAFEYDGHGKLETTRYGRIFPSFLGC
jgi:hypothetical protein